MTASKIDLNIEFEDEEEEAKRLEEERKKRDEVKEVVDLQFSTDAEDDEDESAASGAALKKAQAEARRVALEKKNAAQGKHPAQESQPQVQAQASVADIDQARKAREPVKQAEPSISFTTPDPTHSNISIQRPSASSPHYRLGDELNYATSANALLNAEVQARVQLAVAQARAESIARVAQEAKLLEHKIVKLLTQAHGKAPAAKAELMAIKKMLAEYADPKNLLGESAPESSDKPVAAAPEKKKA